MTGDPEDNRATTLKKYLAATQWEQLDSDLAQYFQAIRTWLKNRKCSEEETQRLIAELCLVAPLHLTRKRVFLEKTGRLAKLQGAFDFDAALVDGIRAAASLKEGEFLHFFLHSQVEVAGFDPRAVDGIEAMSCLRGRAASPNAKHRFRGGEGALLSERYLDAKVKIYRDFHDATTRFDLFLVDVAWLPELAAQGHILALDDHLPRIDRLIAEKLDLSRTVWSRAAVSAVEGTDGYHYGFPYFLNFHGRLIPKRNGAEFENAKVTQNFNRTRTTDKDPAKVPNWVDHLSKSDSPNDLCRTALKLSSVQTASASLVYELFAHMAYQGHLPIVLGSEPRDRSLLPVVIRVDFTSKEALKAVAGLIARLALHKASRAPGGLKSLESIDQVDQRTRLQNAASPEQWGMLFSSELFHELPLVDHTKGRRPLTEDFELIVPFSNETAPSCFLGCLGGYALAVSSEARDVEAAIELALQVFEKSAASNLECGVVPPSLRKLVTLPPDQAATFISTHSRPKLPCWSAVEAIISDAVVELTETLTGSEEDPNATLTDSNKLYQGQVESVSALLAEPQNQRVLRRVEKKVRLVCKNYGLEVRDPN